MQANEYCSVLGGSSHDNNDGQVYGLVARRGCYLSDVVGYFAPCSAKISCLTSNMGVKYTVLAKLIHSTR